jgi:hypothetical protein
MEGARLAGPATIMLPEPGSAAPQASGRAEAAVRDTALPVSEEQTMDLPAQAELKAAPPATRGTAGCKQVTLMREHAAISMVICVLNCIAPGAI